MEATKGNRMELSREVYMQTAAYAREHGQLDIYRQSNKINIDCKQAIEGYIRSHYRDNILNMDEAGGIVESFGTQRTAYVLANTIRHKNYDGRFSYENKRWAETIPMPFTDDNSIVGDRSMDWVVQSHPALLNIFIRSARDIIKTVKAKEQEASRPPVADDIKDLRLLRSSFNSESREYVFSCLNRGEPDTLTYALIRCDDGEGYIFYTQTDNIWDRMDIRERRKLESVLYRAATFGLIEREINTSKTVSDLEFAETSLMETDPESLSMEQWDTLGDMIDEMREKLLNLPEKQEDNPSKAKDSLNRKTVKPKQPKM